MCHLGLGRHSQPFVSVLMNMSHVNLVTTCLMLKECRLLLFNEKVGITFFLISLQVTENTERSEKKMTSVLRSNQSYNFDN